ncbi:MAG: FdtA/QdtA family cupin domain-containing protein [Candidatus Aenigmarchaeota archaeon]|nr:FdtA/QdtA family cupin domain-containing protein [Candidatus Aenigmarchaeota archaeon]
MAEWSFFTVARREDDRGILSAVESGKDVPFQIKRVFYLYAMKKGATRGSHAHKMCEQAFLCLNGSFTITLDNGKKKEKKKLASPSEGVYVPPRIWVELTEFSRDAVVLVLCSHLYDEKDYIRDYGEIRHEE